LADCSARAAFLLISWGGWGGGYAGGDTYIDNSDSGNATESQPDSGGNGASGVADSSGPPEKLPVGYWLKDAAARGIHHICWDGYMFPNAMLEEQKTWNTILDVMIKVRDAHGWN